MNIKLKQDATLIAMEGLRRARSCSFYGPQADTGRTDRWKAILMAVLEEDIDTISWLIFEDPLHEFYGIPNLPASERTKRLYEELKNI